MAGKLNSISAKDISSAVKAAIQNSKTLKGVTATDVSLATLRPPIIGFILRDLDVKETSMSEINSVANSVATKLGHGASAASFVHGGHVIIGYVEDAVFSAVKE